jgi:CRP-like cAMP-binding protein
MQFFKGLSGEEVAKLFSKGTTRNVKKGEVLFYQGTTGSSMFVVLEGKLRLYKDKKKIASLRTGELIGEMALINHEPRSATVIAAEDSDLFELTENSFQRLMTKRASVQILLNIIETLSQRLKQDNEHLVRLTRHIESMKEKEAKSDS